jgi:hypothetical protein
MTFITNAFLILIVLISVFFIMNTFFKYNIHEPFDANNEIPKVIMSTYPDKNKIPIKVFQNINKFASDYTYKIFDDTDIIHFLKTYYPPNVLSTFHQLKRGAHKADLFRYCYLYQFGGIYLDIKTELIRGLTSIFDKKNVQLYTVLSMHNGTIYQGIIGTVPKNPFFIKLIEHITNTPNPKKYFEFTKEFYDQLKIYYMTHNLKNGPIYDVKNNKYHLYLFQEKCSRNPDECNDGIDRYKRCCFIYDNNKKIIKTRYSDYPW